MILAEEYTEEYTHIRVRTRTRDKLKELSEKDESLDSTINRLIEFYENNKTGSRDDKWIVKIPQERFEDVLIAIEETRTPTKWRETIKYFILFTLAGMGLGTFLALLR